MGENAKPVQARSIKTREKLMKAALDMYARKGYHNTTVDEIAAEAGLSTGIAYRYFGNKKDMLLSAVGYGADNIMTIAHIAYPDTEKMKGNMREYLIDVLKEFEQLHARYRGIHEELEGLRHTDEDVRRLYDRIISEKMEGVTGIFGAVSGGTNIREKAYAAVGIMEQYCHMKMNDEYGLDFDVMRELVIDAVIRIIE